jgi:hypothetical protein
MQRGLRKNKLNNGSNAMTDLSEINDKNIKGKFALVPPFQGGSGVATISIFRGGF